MSNLPVKENTLGVRLCERNALTRNGCAANSASAALQPPRLHWPLASPSATGYAAFWTTIVTPVSPHTAMSATVVLGAQFGDEGKGKLVDILLASGEFALVARCAGGHNAGHTLVVDGKKYDFHILPSGLVAPGAVNLVGNGTVCSVKHLLKELGKLQDQGIQSSGRLFISDRAQCLLDLHQRIDGLEEKALGKDSIGTTGNGIGPCYADKAARRGIRVGMILDKQQFDARLRRLATIHKKAYGDLLAYDVEEEIRAFDGWREELRPLIVDSVDMVCNVQDAGKKVLVEGANAIMLDIDGGTYPFVTSSNTGLAGVFSGLAGIRPESLTTRIGVVKAYTTRVGGGPFPTEDFGEVGDKLQSIGHEFGTTTGRRRRCGWLDLVLLRHSHSLNRYTAINLTKVDVLDTFAEVKIAVKYHSKNADGSVTTYDRRFPADLSALDPSRLEVEYVTLKGWQKDISGCRKFADLPEETRAFVDYIEKDLGVPVKWCGVGPARDEMVVKD